MSFVVKPALPARIGILAIGFYQIHLSPRKGFVCAHRVLRGGDSCSQFVKSAIRENGLISGIRDMRRRLRECRKANELLQAKRELLLTSRVMDEEFDDPGHAQGTARNSASPRNGLDLLPCIDVSPCLGDVCVGAGFDAMGQSCSGCDLPAVDCAGCG